MYILGNFQLYTILFKVQPLEWMDYIRILIIRYYVVIWFFYLFRHVFLIWGIHIWKKEKERNFILNENEFVLCLLPFSTPSDATTVTRGLSSLKEFSINQSDDELKKHFNAKLQENGGKVLLHTKRCREFIDNKRIMRNVTTYTTNGTPKKKKLLSQQPNFDWKIIAFFVLWNCKAA